MPSLKSWQLFRYSWGVSNFCPRSCSGPLFDLLSLGQELPFCSSSLLAFVAETYFSGQYVYEVAVFFLFQFVVLGNCALQSQGWINLS